MITHVALLGCAFLALVALPFIPGLLELRWPQDDAPLDVRRDNTREPRHFGRAFRSLVEEHVASVEDHVPSITDIQLRRKERLRVERSAKVPAGDRPSEILVTLDDLTIEKEARAAECYGRGRVTVGDGARVRAIASDEEVTIGELCVIERWVDAERDVKVGAGTHLGVSASSARRLLVSSGCTFTRLWGLPVVTAGDKDVTVPAHLVDLPSEVIWARDQLAVPAGARIAGDIVSRGDVVIGAGATVGGTIKSRGSVTMQPGGRVEGNVLARRSVSLGRNSVVWGNVFAERDLEIDAGVRVGRRGHFKTAYCSGRASVGPAVTVHGWLVAEEGGRIR